MWFWMIFVCSKWNIVFFPNMALIGLFVISKLKLIIDSNDPIQSWLQQDEKHTSITSFIWKKSNFFYVDMKFHPIMSSMYSLEQWLCINYPFKFLSPHLFMRSYFPIVLKNSSCMNLLSPLVLILIGVVKFLSLN